MRQNDWRQELQKSREDDHTKEVISLDKAKLPLILSIACLGVLMFGNLSQSPLLTNVAGAASMLICVDRLWAFYKMNKDFR